jgi:hypothetical protein
MVHPAFRILMFSLLLQVSCGGGPTSPLEMTTLDPSDDHEKIAYYYRHEAALSRQQFEELTDQATVYERVFGPESDEVAGTRLLVQFYKEVAIEQDRLAELHMKIWRDRSSNQSMRPKDR